MTHNPFNYRVLRYVHDPVSGEFINIGIILHSPDTGNFFWRFTHRYDRLSCLFAGFQRNLVSRFVDCLNRELRAVAPPYDPADPFVDVSVAQYRPVGSLDEMVRLLIPDEGGCFQTSPQLGGITSNAIQEVDRLFERYVSRYEPHPSSSRIDDAQLWHSWSTRFERDIRTQFKKVTVFSPTAGKMSFDHSFQNGKLNLIEPVSFDYTQEKRIQARAEQVTGKGVAL